MPTLTLSMTVNGLGEQISRTVRRTADGGGNVEVAVPAGKAGTLSTRTDNETGTLTLGSGHGITTGQVIDLYWATGARYGITVGTVSGTSVPIGADNAGTGSNLPSQGTAIVASGRVTVDCAIDGDALECLAVLQKYEVASETATSRASFRDSGGSEIEGVSLIANQHRLYDDPNSGIYGGNGFTGNPIATVIVSNGSSTNAATFQCYWVQDSTP